MTIAVVMQVYDSAYVWINGELLKENTSVKIEYIGDDKPVSTLTKPYAGCEVGPRTMRVTVSEAMPSRQSESHLIRHWLFAKPVTLKIQLAGSGESLLSKGHLTSPSVESGLGKATSMDVTFVGEAVRFTP